MGRECLQCGDVGQKDDSHPGGTDWDSMRFHHTTQSGAQFKTYELFFCGVFHLIYLDCG